MNETKESELVAWSVEVSSIPCVVFASSWPKAKWIAVKSYREAGYGVKGSWPSCRGGRTKEYDGSTLKKDGPRAYSEGYVLSTL
jgi:hypothetical protein